MGFFVTVIVLDVILVVGLLVYVCETVFVVGFFLNTVVSVVTLVVLGVVRFFLGGNLVGKFNLDGSVLLLEGEAVVDGNLVTECVTTAGFGLSTVGLGSGVVGR